MNTKRVLWVALVMVLSYFHLLVGALVAIATAFYWLLERQVRLLEKQSERPRCARGNHNIGNEPYTYIRDGRKDAGEPVCDRCVKQESQRVDALIKDNEAFLKDYREKKETRGAEWESLTELEKQAHIDAGNARFWGK